MGNELGNATFVLNDININPGGKFKLGSIRRKKNNTAKFEEITDQAEEPIRFKELEGVLSIGEQRALAGEEAE